MKGSYSVTTGNSRAPSTACDRPSAEAKMNRFISAMPSSICWPFGDASQLKVEGIFSLRNRSAFSARANRPRRLTQAPRLVDTVTSGDAVTTHNTNNKSVRGGAGGGGPGPGGGGGGAAAGGGGGAGAAGAAAS